MEMPLSELRDCLIVCNHAWIKVQYLYDIMRTSIFPFHFYPVQGKTSFCMHACVPLKTG